MLIKQTLISHILFVISIILFLVLSILQGGHGDIYNLINLSLKIKNGLIMYRDFYVPEGPIIPYANYFLGFFF